MTRLDDRWLLPEGVEELLPPIAADLERRRRTLLDLYASWGYDLVTPPLIEHLETLLTGTGHDLDLETFKLTDPTSGRLLGVRADITPQVARIDARHSNHANPTRLCYLGSVLRAQAPAVAQSRSPVQVGAELYGHQGIASDVEVLSLMLATLASTGVEGVHLDLGHVGVFRGLVRSAGLDAHAETRIRDALQRKAPDDIDEALAVIADAATRKRMRALMHLNGGEDVLELAREQLRGADAEVDAALDNLAQLVAELDAWGIQVPLHFDLAELWGYAYYTGVVFAALVPGLGQPIARGGRYDAIGRSFGAERPATGFSTDLKTLVALGKASSTVVSGGIAAPWEPDAGLREEAERLRAVGERVVYMLPGTDASAMSDCDRALVWRDGRWQVEPTTAR